MSKARFDAWMDFRTLTSARIALGRAGASLPTRELLDFGLAHARARDAVLAAFDAERIGQELDSAGLPHVLVESAAGNREEYLRRPDLGRRLSEASRAMLQTMESTCNLVIVISDGLSALAVHRHALLVVCPLYSRLQNDGWKIGPVVVAKYGRVALQDQIGSLLRADLALMVLGERPGLGAADSLGAYLVNGPQANLTDANRNCVSNIRPEGLPPHLAVETLYYLLTASRRRRFSGVKLKDERLLLNSGSASSIEVDCSTIASNIRNKELPCRHHSQQLDSISPVELP